MVLRITKKELVKMAREELIEIFGEEHVVAGVLFDDKFYQKLDDFIVWLVNKVRIMDKAWSGNDWIKTVEKELKEM